MSFLTDSSNSACSLVALIVACIDRINHEIVEEHAQTYATARREYLGLAILAQVELILVAVLLQHDCHVTSGSCDTVRDHPAHTLVHLRELPSSSDDGWQVRQLRERTNERTNASLCCLLARVLASSAAQTRRPWHLRYGRC